MAQVQVRATATEVRMCIASGVANSRYSRGEGDAHLRCVARNRLIPWSRRFLYRIRTETNDKIVLISNYTQTLDLFEKMLRSKK